MIESSDFILRYNGESNFLLILYEFLNEHQIRTSLMTKRSTVMNVDLSTMYEIRIKSTVLNSLDLIIVKAETDFIMHLYDLSK